MTEMLELLNKDFNFAIINHASTNNNEHTLYKLKN